MSGDCSSDSYPKTNVYYDDISDDPMSITFMVLGSILGLVSIGLFVEEFLFLRRTFKTQRMKTIHLVTMIGLFPMVCVASAISLIVPTSTEIVDFVSSCYLSFCIYTFVHMTIGYFGGQSAMIEFFANEKIRLNTPPCCCICCCICKPITLTKPTLRKLELLAMQVSVIQPVVLFVELIMWTDGKKTNALVDLKEPLTYLNVVSTVSTILSMYGMIVIFRASRAHLGRYRIVARFLCIQLPVVLLNIQRVVFNGLAARDKPPCIGVLSPNVRSSNIFHGLLAIEFFLLSLLARRAYRIDEQNEEELTITSDVKIKPYTTEASGKVSTNSQDVKIKPSTLEASGPAYTNSSEVSDAL